MTCEDNYLKDSVLARRPEAVGRFDRLHPSVEHGLRQLIDTEIAMARELESLKRYLAFGPDYSAPAAFETVDISARGSIDIVNLGSFMRGSWAYPLESDLNAIIRRIDLDGDQ